MHSNGIYLTSLLIATRQKLGKCQGIKLNVNIFIVDLPCVNSTKILGVHIDATLSWKDHVTQVRKKISENLFLVKSIKCFLPLNGLHENYFMIVTFYPILIFVV